MNKPIISDKFTIEDIHKIREWHYEERKRTEKERYRKELEAKVAKIMKELPKAKYISI